VLALRRGDIYLDAFVDRARVVVGAIERHVGNLAGSVAAVDRAGVQVVAIRARKMLANLAGSGTFETGQAGAGLRAGRADILVTRVVAGTCTLVVTGTGHACEIWFVLDKYVCTGRQIGGRVAHAVGGAVQTVIAIAVPKGANAVLALSDPALVGRISGTLHVLGACDIRHNVQNPFLARKVGNITGLGCVAASF
jgi:hypothetical protein